MMSSTREKIAVGVALLACAGLFGSLLMPRSEPARKPAAPAPIAREKKSTQHPVTEIARLARNAARPAAAPTVTGPARVAEMAAQDTGETDGDDETDTDDDTEDAVDVDAVKADLARFGIKDVPKALIEAMDGNWKIRAEFAKFLPNDAAKLEEMLGAEAPLARIAAEKLGDVGNNADVPAMLRALVSSDTDYGVRQALADSIAKLAGPEDRDRVLALFGGTLDGDQAGPLTTAALGVLGNDGAQQVAAMALDQGRSPEVRAAMLEAMGEAPGKFDQFAPAILQGLDDPNVAVEKGAIAALGNADQSAHRAEAVSKLTAMVLASDDAEVRAEAASTLGSLGDKNAVTALSRALAKEQDQAARENIHEAIVDLEGS